MAKNKQSSTKTAGAVNTKKKARKEKPFKEAKPVVPSVNLLPPRLEFEKNKQVTKRSLKIIAVGFVITCAVLMGAQLVLNHFANAEVDVERAQLEQKNEQLQELNHISLFVDAIEQRETLIAKLQGDQMNYVSVTNDVIDALPVSGSIENISLNVLKSRTGTPVELAQQCGPVVDPIGIADAAIVGCLTATINVPVGADPAAMTQRLSNSALLVNVDVSEIRVESSTPGNDAPTVQNQFKISAAVLSAGLLRAAPVEQAPPVVVANKEDEE